MATGAAPRSSWAIRGNDAADTRCWLAAEGLPITGTPCCSAVARTLRSTSGMAMRTSAAASTAAVAPAAVAPAPAPAT